MSAYPSDSHDLDVLAKALDAEVRLTVWTDDGPVEVEMRPWQARRLAIGLLTAADTTEGVNGHADGADWLVAGPDA